MTANELKAWWGPAFLPHPGWTGGPWLDAFKFEALTAAAAIRQAEDAYDFVRPRTRVEIAKDEAEVREALASFMAEKSTVLKICPVAA